MTATNLQNPMIHGRQNDLHPFGHAIICDLFNSFVFAIRMYHLR